MTQSVQVWRSRDPERPGQSSSVTQRFTRRLIDYKKQTDVRREKRNPPALLFLLFLLQATASHVHTFKMEDYFVVCTFKANVINPVSQFSKK